MWHFLLLIDSHFFPAIFWKLFEFGFSIIVSWKIKWSVLMEMDSWHKNFKCEDSNFTSLAKFIEMAGLLWNSMSTFLNQIKSLASMLKKIVFTFKMNLTWLNSIDLIRIIDIWRLLGSDCMLESCIVLKKWMVKQYDNYFLYIINIPNQGVL